MSEAAKRGRRRYHVHGYLGRVAGLVLTYRLRPKSCEYSTGFLGGRNSTQKQLPKGFQRTIPRNILIKSSERQARHLDLPYALVSTMLTITLFHVFMNAMFVSAAQLLPCIYSGKWTDSNGMVRACRVSYLCPVIVCVLHSLCVSIMKKLLHFIHVHG